MELILRLCIPAKDEKNVAIIFGLQRDGLLDDDAINFIEKPGLFGAQSHYEIIAEGDQVTYLIENLRDRPLAPGFESLPVWRKMREYQLTLKFGSAAGGETR